MTIRRFRDGRGMPSAVAAAGILFLAAVAAIPAGCGRKERPGRAAGGPTVSGVQLAIADAVERGRTAEATGTVKAATVAAVASQVMGRIVSIPVAEGSRVAKGDLLAAIDDLAIRAQVGAAEGMVAEAEAAREDVERAIAQAEAGKTFAEKTFERFRALHEERIVTRHEFDEVEAKRTVAVNEYGRALNRRAQVQARIAQARAQADSARAMLSYTRVTAPFAGVVTETMVDPGSMAVPGVPIVVLEDTSRYRIEASVPAAYFGTLKAGTPVWIVTDVDQDKGIPATVSEVVPRVDPESRTFIAKVDLPRGIAARTGMFARVRFATGSERVVTVPRGAISTAGGYDGLFAVGDDNVARLVVVKTGEAFDDRVEILSGIGPGTRVAVSPIDRLVDGARVEVGK